MATFLDEEGAVQWYPAVIVEYRPNARIYHYVVHFDADGEDILVGLPDDGVQLLTATATHCMCPRCLLSHPVRASCLCEHRLLNIVGDPLELNLVEYRDRYLS